MRGCGSSGSSQTCWSPLSDASRLVAKSNARRPLSLFTSLLRGINESAVEWFPPPTPVLNRRAVVWEWVRETGLLDHWVYVTSLKLPVTPRVWGFMMSHDIHIYIFYDFILLTPRACILSLCFLETWDVSSLASHQCVSVCAAGRVSASLSFTLLCLAFSRAFFSFSDAVPMTDLFPWRNVQFTSLHL